MQAELDEIVQDKGKTIPFSTYLVVVKNIGTTTVTYEWKKVHRKDLIPSKNSDFAHRFFCHYVSQILVLNNASHEAS